MSDAQRLFEGTGVQVTVEGKHHLGAALGSHLFTEQYVSEKVDSWSCCVAKLSDIAKVHPHNAYSAFTHGLCNKWTYFLRTIPGISSLLEPLEAVISSKFILALTGRFISDDERALLALPIRLGGLGIVDPQTVSDSEFAASEKVTSPLVGLILQQDISFGCHVDAQHLPKSEVIASKRQAAEERATSVCDSLPSDMKRMIFLLSEKGASSWLSALPVEEHGFALHKGAFRDTLFLCYGWLPSGLPVHCVCGQGFSVDHALNCPTGGYPTLRHNELCDFTAEILSEVCADVCTEPPLQLLLGETLTYATANVEDGALLDISAAGFWGGQHQKAYFDVKVFNPNASRSRYRGSQASSLYRKFEKDKRRKYEQRIREIELASFTPLVFSTSGGMSGCTNVFFKRLAYLFSLKKKLDYGNVMAWLRCRLSFSLLCSAISCLRGAQSHHGCLANRGALDLALAEGQVCDHAN